MPSYLNDLQLRISKVDPRVAIQPQTEVGPNDHVVGIMSDHLKQLYHLREETVRMLGDLGKHLETEMSPEEEDGEDGEESIGDSGLDGSDDLGELQKKVNALYHEWSVLDRLFWHSVCHEFSEIAHKQIGCRKGWKVVWTDEEVCPHCHRRHGSGLGYIDAAVMMGRRPPGFPFDSLHRQNPDRN